MVSVSNSGIRRFDNEEIVELRNKLDDIKSAERSARERVIDEWSTD